MKSIVRGNIGRLASTGGFLLTMVALTQAADMPAPAPLAAPWAGPYIGAHIGYAALNSKNSISGVGAQSWKQNADGPLGGVLLGYNFDMGGYMLGVEADAGFGGISKTTQRPGFGSYKITNHGQHTFRARAGVPFDMGLFYVTAGLGLTDIWITGNGIRNKKFSTGFTGGAGFETMVSDQISVRLEYLYGTYGKKTYSFGGTAVRTKFDTHNVRIGASWHFN